GRDDDRGGFRRGDFFARAARVARSLLDSQLVAPVGFGGDVFLFAGPEDARAAGQRSFAVALQPLVGEAGGVVGPFPVVLDQRLALLSFAFDRGRSFAAGHGRDDDRGGFRRGDFFARAARVARSLLDSQLVAHVGF